MIVADTGAIIALIDAGDRHHRAFVKLFDKDPGAWILPWAILPEVDHLLSRHVGQRATEQFLHDIATGAFSVEWGTDADLRRAHELSLRYEALHLGLVDCVVAAVAERLRAAAIATTDLRDFGALELVGRPKLLPRDLK